MSDPPPPPGSTFPGTVALVTGGAGGVGQAIVSALVDRGARVAALDRVDAPAATLSVRVDAADPGDVRRAVAQVTTELGVVRHLVCATGVVSEHEVVDLVDAEWDRVVSASLTATFVVCREVVPGMRRAGTGTIVAFSSGYATRGYRAGAHYAAAKAGVEAFVKSLALEVAADGVRVNAIAPGPVLTPLLSQVTADVEAFRRDRERWIPLGRVAEPGDMTGPTLFLLGPDSGYVTGQVLHVNGGMLMP